MPRYRCFSDMARNMRQAALSGSDVKFQITSPILICVSFLKCDVFLNVVCYLYLHHVHLLYLLCLLFIFFPLHNLCCPFSWSFSPSPFSDYYPSLLGLLYHVFLDDSFIMFYFSMMFILPKSIHPSPSQLVATTPLLQPGERPNDALDGSLAWGLPC